MMIDRIQKTAVLPTEYEAERIRGGDRELINRYYMANYDFILVVARGYCRARQLGNRLFFDITQEVYLYFPTFNFSTVQTFIRGIRDVAVYVRFGGERSFHQYRQGRTELLTILDEPYSKDAKHSDEATTFGDMIASDFDIFDEIEPPKDYCDDIHDIAAVYLSPRQAEAFEYFYYTDITAKDVGQKMGIGMNGAQSLKTAGLKKLRAHAADILEQLRAIDYPVDTLCA